MTTPGDHDIDIQEDVESLRGSRTSVEPFDWFSRLWGVAIVAHIVGNPRIGGVVPEFTALGVASLVLGLSAIALTLRPSDRRLLRLSSVLLLATVWLEAPFVGNHWVLGGFVSIALLIALSGSNSWNWFSSTGRGIHIVFYSFAAFAKLNTSFLDPSVSCGVVYANQSLDSFGLPVLSATGIPALLVVYGATAIELVIPVLLLIRRTRNIGVVLGLVFHTLISYDLGQHFFDFTALLIPLFLLWAPTSATQPLGRRFTGTERLAAGMALGLLVVSTVVPLNTFTLFLLRRFVFALWIPGSIALVVFVVRRLRGPADLSVKPLDAVAWLLLGLVALNGVTPYVELKTGTSWNMYSNLYTTDGESNHLVIRSTVPLSNGQTDPVRIIESSDPGLAEYIDSGYLLPERTFLDYLADHPDAEVTIEQDGVVEELTGADGRRLNPLLDRFALLRAIDTQHPTRCQTVWLPAR